MALGLISNVELAAEWGIRPKLLYRWRDLRKRHGEGAFQRKLGRPRGSTGAGPGRPTVVPSDGPLVLVSAERKRIAELERQLGRKQLEVDFFSTGLRACQGNEREQYQADVGSEQNL